MLPDPGLTVEEITLSEEVREFCERHALFGHLAKAMELARQYFTIVGEPVITYEQDPDNDDEYLFIMIRVLEAVSRKSCRPTFDISESGRNSPRCRRSVSFGCSPIVASTNANRDGPSRFQSGRHRHRRETTAERPGGVSLGDQPGLLCGLERRDGCPGSGSDILPARGTVNTRRL